MHSEIMRHKIGKASDAAFRLLFVVVCLILLTVCGVYVFNGRYESRPTDWVDAVKAMPSLRWYYDYALTKARAWKPDAALYWMTVNIYPPASYRLPEWILAFFSPTDPLGMYKVGFRDDKITLTEEVVQPLPPGVVPIDPSTLGVSDKDAFYIAYHAGGASYVDQFEGAMVTLVLRRLHPLGSGPAWWTVRFADMNWRYRDFFAIHANSRDTVFYFSNEQDYLAWESD